jgi:cystathionine beta-lyase/cystathionine gamma-synthase
MSSHRESSSNQTPEQQSAAAHRAEPRRPGGVVEPKVNPKGSGTDPFVLSRHAAAVSAGAVAGIAQQVSGAKEDGAEDLSGEWEGADPYSTIAIHGGLEPDPVSGAILTPIVQSTTYVQQAVGQHKGHTYSRASNPTVSALERALGAIEGTLPAVAFNTGMSAISTLFFATVKAGDHVVVGDAVYGGTVRFINLLLAQLGVEASFVDTSNAAHVRAAIRPTTKLVLIETPANPTLKLADVGAIAQVCQELGVLLAVDNTFMTPVLLRPLDLGAHIAVYSTTKYIEGHNATVGGSLSSRDAALLERFRLIRKTLGSIQAPFEAWLTLRGLKTLPLRIRQHSRNALKVARFLEQHPAVVRVNYPGLKSFPQHELAQKLHGPFGGFHGGMLSFEVKGGVEAGIKVMNSVKLCSLAENLGAVETLITHPVSMTHGDVPVAQRLAAGITDGLVRLSVGLEEPADIIADLNQALAIATGLRGLEKAGNGSDSGKVQRDVRIPVAGEVS